MKTRFLVLVATVALVVGAAAQAQAAIIGTPSVQDSTNCSSSDGCYGFKWTLTFTDAADMDSNTFAASLLIQDDPLVGDYDFATAGIGYISAVDIKGATGIGAVNNSTLTSAPGGVAGWTTTEKKTNNNGCMAGSSGSICSEDLPAVSLAPVATVTGGGSLLWQWAFTSTTIPFYGHIGAKFDNAAGDLNGYLLSADLEDGGQDGGGGAPEPGMLLLLGTGLVLGGARLRKRK